MKEYIRRLEETILKYNGEFILNRAREDKTNYLNLITQKLDATYMFIDIKGFTKYSEKIIADNLLDDLNLYFKEMSRSILLHNGYIDSFIGDAIFAIFGLSKRNHADDACNAAMDCKRKLEIVNQRIEHKGIFKIGIGINTGISMIGNIGSEYKLKYTAMGDMVNLASRMESLTTRFGAQIVISENTKEMLKKDYTINELETVEVKGLPDKVRVFELL